MLIFFLIIFCLILTTVYGISFLLNPSGKEKREINEPGPLISRSSLLKHLRVINRNTKHTEKTKHTKKEVNLLHLLNAKLPRRKDAKDRII